MKRPPKAIAPLDDIIRRTKEVYASLATLEVSRQCVGRSTCCQFLRTGKTPMLTIGEALVAAQGLRASGRARLPVSTDPASGRCPMLNSQNQCSIYSHRPFGCRTHFCAAAGGPYPRKMVHGLIQELESIAESLRQTDPRPILGAISDGLAWLDKDKRRS